MMQIYIWKFTGEKDILVFAMQRLVLGNKPSAYCSQIAIEETAYLWNNNNEYPDAKKPPLTEDSYVDNTFTMADNVDEIRNNIKQIEQVANQEGYFYKP